jgi:hypothetical protein
VTTELDSPGMVMNMPRRGSAKPNTGIETTITISARQAM